MSGSRSISAEGLKELKAPQEGGTSEEYETWGEKLEAHTVTWPVGHEVAAMISQRELAVLDEPDDLKKDASVKETIRFEAKMKLFVQKEE